MGGGGLFQVLLAELLDFKSPKITPPQSFILLTCSIAVVSIYLQAEWKTQYHMQLTYTSCIHKVVGDAAKECVSGSC